MPRKIGSATAPRKAAESGSALEYDRPQDQEDAFPFS